MFTNWSVQAIDTAIAGSPFATEVRFLVTHPPVAVATLSNTPAYFSAAKLAVNDLDVDGYPLTMTGVSPNSTQGGAVVLASAHITCTPPTNFGGNDAFTYTVSDGLGGFATGTVIVTVGRDGSISLNIVSGPLVDGGDFVVRFAGIPGFTYTIEATDVMGGLWTKVTSLTAPVTDTGFGIGVFEFREPMGANSTLFFADLAPGGNSVVKGWTVTVSLPDTGSTAPLLLGAVTLPGLICRAEKPSAYGNGGLVRFTRTADGLS